MLLVEVETTKDILKILMEIVRTVKGVAIRQTAGRVGQMKLLIISF